MIRLPKSEVSGMDDRKKVSRLDVPDDGLNTCFIDDAHVHSMDPDCSSSWLSLPANDTFFLTQSSDLLIAPSHLTLTNWHRVSLSKLQ
mmetsp:Transcript_5714/g.8078  ORF Transcript_5714/g.8078 Transcript_5714/m.8078 type:complete len:88 (+) Transcript_5714:414-677(+)